MTLNRMAVSRSLDRHHVRWITKIVLLTGILGLLLGILSMLPGIGRLIHGITLLSIVVAMASIAVAAMLVSQAATIATKSRGLLTTQLADDLASLVHWGVVMAALLVLYRGLEPLFGGLGLIYEVVFLALTLPPVAIIAARLLFMIDPVTDIILDRLWANQ